MFDTHIHLNDEKLYENLDEHIKEAKENGVHNFLVIGYNISSSILAVEIAKKYKGVCFAAVGIHPTDYKEYLDKENVDRLNTLIIENKEYIKAIGEIGLDYYWIKDKDEQEKEKEVFKKQILLAKTHSLPISIHSRDATQDTLDIIKNSNYEGPFVLHAFNASKEIMNQYLKMNVYFGIGGVVTFNNAANLKMLIKEIPLNRLLIETDAPYLAPVPNRGKLNEPKYIKFTLKYIASLLNVDSNELDLITTNNAKRIFLNEKDN